MTVYLDHASATPLLPAAADAMAAAAGIVADPARVHSAGRVARHAVESARDDVAAWCGVRPRDLIFTSGGTEACNWVVYAACGLTPRSDGPWGRRVVVSAVEHTAVLDAARLATQRAGVDLVTVGVDADGVVDVAALAHAVADGDTALVAVQSVNHETGVRQPVDEIRDVTHAAGAKLLVDACQSVWSSGAPDASDAAGASPVPAADFVAVTSHKLGGPAGIGALGVARRLRVDPLFVGGEQELLRRAGGENVAGALGFAAACRAHLDGDVTDPTALRDRLTDGLDGIDGVTALARDVPRAAHIVAAVVPGLKGEALLIGLDRAGIACNSGSSCSAERMEPSHVLEAMGADADASLRFSFGWDSTDGDVDAVLDALPPLVRELRAYARTP